MVRNIRLKVFLMKTVFTAAGALSRLIRKDSRKVLIYANEGFRDNSRYLFDYMLRNGYQRKYRIIVASDDYKELLANPVPGVKYESCLRGVADYLSAGCVYYSFGKIPIVPCGKQKVIQMWHGTSFKGFDKSLRAGSSVGKQYYTHVFASSEFFRPIVMKKFGVTNDRVFICGHPRTDVFYEDDGNRYFPEDTRLVIWLPTFRKSSRLGYADTEASGAVPIFKNEELPELNEKLAGCGLKMIVKLHPLQDTGGLKVRKFSNLELMTQEDFAGAGYDLYRLLKETCALVTDYSSVFYDYLLLDRPIGFTEDDEGEYQKNRGFAVENPDDMKPGMRIPDKEAFYRFLDMTASGQDDFGKWRERIRTLANAYTDGQNCRRAMEAGGLLKD